MKLIFIYNANSGLISTTKDFFHKILSPETYECKLCAITYSNFGMKNKWSQFLKSLPYESIFLHKNELETYKEIKSEELPAVFVEESNGRLRNIIDKNTFNKISSLDELINKLQDLLKY